MKRSTKKRFNALLCSFASKKGVSEQKARTLSAEDKKFMCELIVRDRAAILSALIPNDPDFLSWLNSMGYLYRYTNKQGLEFLGTSFHELKFAARKNSTSFTNSN